MQISIIMPVYNTADFLKTCMESLLNQTFRDFELLAIDDGSTDGSAELLDAYAAKDPRVKVFHQENQGQAASRNYGLEQMRGDFVCFVDSDDGLSSDFLESLHELALAENADIVTTGYLKAETWQKLPVADKKVEIFNQQEGQASFYSGKRVPFYIMPWGKLYRKAIFEGLRFPVGKFVEDEFVAHELFYRSQKTAYLHGARYFYRQHAGSTMKGYALPNAEDACEMFRQRIAFLEEHDEPLFALQTRDQFSTYCLSLQVDFSEDTAIRRLADEQFREQFLPQYRRHFRRKIRLMGQLYLKKPKLFLFLMKISKRFGLV